MDSMLPFEFKQQNTFEFKQQNPDTVWQFFQKNEASRVEVMRSRKLADQAARKNHKRALEKQRRVLLHKKFQELGSVLGVASGRGKHKLQRVQLLDSTMETLEKLRSENAMLLKEKERLAFELDAVRSCPPAVDSEDDFTGMLDDFNPFSIDAANLDLDLGMKKSNDATKPRLIDEWTLGPSLEVDASDAPLPFTLAC